jgi:protease-4
MSIDSDWLVDRRRLKRRASAWRVATVVAVIAALLVAIGRFDPFGARAHVARVAIEGIIVDDPQRDRALGRLAEDTAAKAVIVRIDSPGGTVVGGEELYQRLRRISDHKPVVAVLGELGTSAAYMTALGSNRIVAHAGSLTGSVGVILQTADLTGLLDKLGVKPETVKSGPLKAQPNPLEPFTEEARDATRTVVADVFRMFISMVQERRSLNDEQVAAIADGRVLTGRQAFDLGLVDALGSEYEAREWLTAAQGIDRSLPTRDVDLRDPEQRLQDVLLNVAGNLVFPETLRLDGVISLWHPSR